MRGGDDRGSGTVLVAGVIALALGLLLVEGALVSVELARARAQTAADFAALAAAQVATGSGEGEPCEVAAEACAAAEATLQACTLEGLDVRVRVSVPVAAAGQWWRVRSQARAGPAHVP